MKRIILPILAVLMLVLACGEGKSPEQVVDNFLTACKDKDKEAALVTVNPINELEFDYLWGAIESGEVAVKSWTEPKVVESEEADEEGFKEFALVETDITIIQAGEEDTDTIEFEMVRTEDGWFIFDMN